MYWRLCDDPLRQSQDAVSLRALPHLHARKRRLNIPIWLTTPESPDRSTPVVRRKRSMIKHRNSSLSRVHPYRYVFGLLASEFSKVAGMEQIGKRFALHDSIPRRLPRDSLYDIRRRHRGAIGAPVLDVLLELAVRDLRDLLASIRFGPADTGGCQHRAFPQMVPRFEILQVATRLPSEASRSFRRCDASREAQSPPHASPSSCRWQSKRASPEPP